MKQKMLEHESVYKNQVFELQHLYRVQKNRMDDVRKREQYEDRTRNETSSSSNNALPSQTTPDYTHMQNSSRFLFTNSACAPPPSSNPEFRSSGSDIYKGKGVQDARMPFKNCGSPNNHEPRPTKLRKMIDLELPADMYVDTDEEQCHNMMNEEKLFPSQLEKTAAFLESESNSRLRKRYALADLNEPPEAEELAADPPVDVLGAHRRDLFTKVPNLSEDVSWKNKHLNFNSSLSYTTGNGQNWFSSTLKAERNKDNGRTIHQTNQSERPYRPLQVGYENPQRPRGFPPHLVMEDSLHTKQNNDSIIHGKSNSLSSFGNPAGLSSPQPSYAYSSNLVRSWNLSSERSTNHLNQKPMPVQMTPFPKSESFSKSSQSSPQVNDFHGVWHKNGVPTSRSSFQSETPVNNVPAHFSKAGIMDYRSVSCIDNASSSSFVKAKSPIDLNSKTELDLNVVPNDLCNEQEDSVSVVPWDNNNNKAILKSRNCTDKPKCDQVSNTFDHQSCLTSASSKEIDSGKKKLPFDINVAFEEEVIEPEKIVRNMIDLNSCITEDEIPSWTNKRCVMIDLEAPADMEGEEEGSCSVPDEQVMLKEAAEAIVAISVSVSSPSAQNDEMENVLSWFADVICCSVEDTTTDCDSDSFEEMNLRLIGCSVEEYFPDPPDFEFLGVEEGTGGGPSFVTGGRRTRRGRQKRDFQRDILPGITSLARHEITEDIQTFGGLMRATGYVWSCGGSRKSNGSGRGRRRKQPLTPPPGEVMTAEDRSLTGWGKTTRRPRRQRASK